MSTYSTKLALNDILTHIFFFIPIDYLINVNYCLETNNNMILSRISLIPKMCFLYIIGILYIMFVCKKVLKIKGK